MIEFFYGADSTYVNITNTVFARCAYGNHIYIPTDDALRGAHFEDPLSGVFKNILVVRNESGASTTRVYDGATPVDLTLTPEEMRELGRSAEISRPPAELSIHDRIRHVHAQLQFTGGNVAEEWPEQWLTMRYLDPAAKVLEIGAGIGRNTLLISALLDNDQSLVALEVDPEAVGPLRVNRFVNNRHFAVEPSALSYRSLVRRGWDTIPSDELLAGYHSVSTITYAELETKYSIEFDTLILDCAGAIYYVLQDNPDVLRNIRMIISLSDYRSVEHKRWVDATLRDNGLQLVHSEGLLGREFLPEPDECQKSYYEVWTK